MITKLKTPSKGFTIIELIVVIAIIALLASIVLVNVTTYINKGKDGAMKENMHTLQTDAISNSNSGSDFSTACLDAVWPKIGGAGGPYSTGSACVVPDTPTAWCACVKELGSVGTYYCVDSSGATKEQTVNNCSAECNSTAAQCQ